VQADPEPQLQLQVVELASSETLYCTTAEVFAFKLDRDHELVSGTRHRIRTALLFKDYANAGFCPVGNN
jgi:hypothetical protein